MSRIRLESIRNDVTSSENIAAKNKKRGKNKLQLPKKVNLWLGAYFPGWFLSENIWCNRKINYCYIHYLSLFLQMSLNMSYLSSFGLWCFHVLRNVICRKSQELVQSLFRKVWQRRCVSTHKQMLFWLGDTEYTFGDLPGKKQNQCKQSFTVKFILREYSIFVDLP